MFRLTTVEPADKNSVFEFQDSCDIGRGQNCHVRIASPNVSRLQARIRRGSSGYELEHLGSSSPTLLNDEPVAGSEHLTDGDLIRIAKYALRFDVEEQTASELNGVV